MATVSRFSVFLLSLHLFLAPSATWAQSDLFSSTQPPPASRKLQATRWVETAETYLQQGRWLEAEGLLDQAIAAQHNLADAFMLRAKVREHRHNLRGAATDYSSAIYLHPERYEARFQRALVYFNDQRYAEARIDFLTLIDLPAGETNSVYFREEAQGDSLVTTGITTLQSDMRLDIYNFVGLTHWHQGEYADAHDYFAKAIALAPHQPMAYLNQGLTYEARQDTVNAIAFYQEALGREPGNATALRNLSSLARQQNDTGLLNEIVQISGAASYEALLQLGVNELSQQDFAAAIGSFTQALALQPNASEALLQRGFAHQKADHIAEALADYSEAIAADPLAEKAFSNRGNVYFKNERYDLAVADYTRALALNPDNAVALFNRAVAYQRLGQLTEACQDWQRAQALGNVAAVRPLTKLCEQ